MINQANHVFQLLEDFINFRQRGTNRDDAWYKVLELAAHNTEVQDGDIKQLLTLAKDWERREGYKYHYQNKDDAKSTIIKPLVKKESVIKPLSKGNVPIAREPAVSRPAPLMTGQLNPEALRTHEKKQMEQVLDAPPRT